MFGKTFRLPVRLAGIPLQVDISFLLILPLLAYLIGSSVGTLATLWHIPQARELQVGLMPYLLGLIAALGLFICVILHELGHALTARIFGVKVRSITLWFLGGVAQFETMPRQRGAEALVGIAGPIVSFILAAIFMLLLPVAHNPPLQFIIAYLAYTNFILALFNLIPAIPLDGGRILRSLLALAMPYERATELAATVSRVLAIAMGVFALFTFQFFLLLVAIFVFMAVRAETGSAQVEHFLSGAHVADFMTRDVRAVPPTLTLEELSRQMLRDHHLGFPVVDDAGTLMGVITIQQLDGYPGQTPVSEIMSRGVPTVHPGDEAATAFRRLQESPIGRLPVVDDTAHLVGLVTKTDLLHLLRVRSLAAHFTHRTHLHPA